jgi:hypothetical protein
LARWAKHDADSDARDAPVTTKLERDAFGRLVAEEQDGERIAYQHDALGADDPEGLVVWSSRYVEHLTVTKAPTPPRRRCSPAWMPRGDEDDGAVATEDDGGWISIVMRPPTAHMKNGKLVLDEHATDLPGGTEVELYLVDDEFDPDRCRRVDLRAQRDAVTRHSRSSIRNAAARSDAARKSSPIAA